MMEKVFYDKGCIPGAVQIHLDPHPIPIIKIKIDTKFKKDYVKIKLHINPVLVIFYMHEFKMSLVDNGDT